MEREFSPDFKKDAVVAEFASEDGIVFIFTGENQPSAGMLGVAPSLRFHKEDDDVSSRYSKLTMMGYIRLAYNSGQESSKCDSEGGYLGYDSETFLNGVTFRSLEDVT